jgi:hypothetical protein
MAASVDPSLSLIWVEDQDSQYTEWEEACREEDPEQQVRNLSKPGSRHWLNFSLCFSSLFCHYYHHSSAARLRQAQVYGMTELCHQ